MSNHGVLASDYPFHYERLLELHHDILAGQLPLVRQSYGALQGGAVMAYYPWLTLLPMVALTFVIHNHILLLQVSALLIMISWLVSAYYSSKSYFRSARKSLYFAMVYSGSMEAMLFEQCDIGTDLALIFVPMVFFGFLHLKAENHWKMLTVGMTLLIYSHVVTSVLMITLLLVLFLLNIKSFMDKMRTLVMAGMITVASTVFFWLPALWLAMQNSVTAPVNKYGFSHFGLWFFPALVIIVLPIVMTIAMIRRYTRFDKELLIVGTLCGALMIAPIGNAVADIFPFLKSIQFSERFMPLLAIIGSFLATKYVRVQTDKMLRRMSKVLLCFVILLNPLILSAKSEIAVGSHHVHKMYLSQTRFHDHMYKMPISWAYDYSPKDASDKLHRFKYHKAKITPEGTYIMLKTNQSHVIVPVTVYRGLHYQFKINGKKIRKSDVDSRLMRRYNVLVLNKMSKGRHLVTMNAVKV